MVAFLLISGIAGLPRQTLMPRYARGQESILRYARSVLHHNHDAFYSCHRELPRPSSGPCAHPAPRPNRRGHWGCNQVALGAFTIIVPILLGAAKPGTQTERIQA